MTLKRYTNKNSYMQNYMRLSFFLKPELNVSYNCIKSDRLR